MNTIFELDTDPEGLTRIEKAVFGLGNIKKTIEMRPNSAKCWHIKLTTANLADPEISRFIKSEKFKDLKKL